MTDLIPGFVVGHVVTCNTPVTGAFDVPLARQVVTVLTADGEGGVRG
jgi:hypothetical protein